jgi:hypothetical protein
MTDKDIMNETNRTAVAAYVAAERHLKGNLRSAKTLTKMAAELGTTKNTVRRWLRRDHWDLWMEHWASVEEIWEAGERVRQRQGGWLVDEQRSGELKAALDLSLALLLAGSDEPDGDLISGLADSHEAPRRSYG